eukprot:3465532-Rhodomonas_salina.2
MYSHYFYVSEVQGLVGTYLHRDCKVAGALSVNTQQQDHQHPRILSSLAMRQQRSFRRAVFCAVIALLSALSYAAAVTPDCSETQCHFLAWCDFNSANQPVCNCLPGTIDKSGSIAPFPLFELRIR